MTLNGESARLSFDSTARTLIVDTISGQQRIGLFADTEIGLVGTGLRVARLTFEPDERAARPVTMMDVEQFAVRLRQIAKANRVPSETKQPIRSTPGPKPQRHRGTGRRAYTVAKAVEGTMWVLLVLSVVGGLIISFQQEPQCELVGSDCSFSTKYPLFGFGVALMAGGVVQCLMIIMVAAYIQARADGSVH